MKTLLAAGILAFATLPYANLTGQEDDLVVVKKPFGHQPDKGHAQSSIPQILYHGGSILLGQVPMYAIYYGNFAAGTQAIVNDFLGGLSGQPRYEVNTTYCDVQTVSCATAPGANSISGTLAYPKANIFYDTGSQGTQINSGGVLSILQYEFQHGLPAVDDAIYFVFTSPDVKVTGFCTSFCAYHSRSTKVAPGHVIHYALVPDPSQKCTACDGNFALGDTGTPNGDAGADEMVDSLFHELSETVTDPDLNAWFTSNGAENGDLCNYNYGATSVDKNGIHYNASWSGRNFLIQLIWKNSPVPQSCAAAP